jgi:PTS system nitrogen regulatory IIA component
LQLTVRDVGKFLNASESSITQWIKQRGLPAQRIGGQYRFHRADVLEWATANHIKVSLELFDSAEDESEAQSSLADALDAGGIFYDIQDTSKERALRAMVQVLPLPDGIDRELLLRLFLAREAAASKAIGDGIAVPHVRNPIVLHVARPTVTLCFLEKPVDFGAFDGVPVHVLFSIISPTNRSHLQLLSRLSSALHDSQFKDAIKRQAQPDEIMRQVRRVEAGMMVAPSATRKAAP